MEGLNLSKLVSTKKSIYGEILQKQFLTLKNSEKLKKLKIIAIDFGIKNQY